MFHKTVGQLKSGDLPCRLMKATFFFWTATSLAGPRHFQLGAIWPGEPAPGWVAFENVAYVDKQPKAQVELRPDVPSSSVSTSAIYKTETNEHGFYDFHLAGLGRFKLVITAKGFELYSADVYITSDFTGNWAVQPQGDSGEDEIDFAGLEAWGREDGHDEHLTPSLCPF